MNNESVLTTDDSFNKKWNRRESHNCYSYFLNLKSPEAEQLCIKEFADLNYCRRSQPGYAAGYDVLEKKNLTCPEVLRRTLDDNPTIKQGTFEQMCDADSYKGALVVDQGNDYHYYRLNDDGHWTHKPGYKPSTAYDADGQLIYNPQLANRNYGRLNYSDFCGYFCVPRQSTKKRMEYIPIKEKNSKGITNRNRTNRNRTNRNRTNRNRTNRNRTNRNRTNRNLRNRNAKRRNKKQR